MHAYDRRRPNEDTKRTVAARGKWAPEGQNHGLNSKSPGSLATYEEGPLTGETGLAADTQKTKQPYGGDRIPVCTFHVPIHDR